MNRRKLSEVIKAGRFEWRKHTLQRLAERGISQSAVIDVLIKGEEIENYPDDKPYPSALFLGWVEGNPLHIVVALDEKKGWVYIITAYEPNLKYFEANFKTRRK
jgi:hypothetical protein